MKIKLNHFSSSIFICLTIFLFLILTVCETARHGLKRGRSRNSQKASYGDSYSSAVSETLTRRGRSQKYRKVNYGYTYSSATNHRQKNKNSRRVKNRKSGAKEKEMSTESLLVGCQFLTGPREYRTIDGSFNNLKNPSLGASHTPWIQTFPPVFDDGFNVPIGTDPTRLYNGFPLPLPREISLEFRADAFQDSTKFSDIHLHFAQLIFSDVLDSEFIFITCPEVGLACADACEYREPCTPVITPDDDPFFDSQEQCSILNLQRTPAVCGTGTTRKRPKRDFNLASSYIDGSQIYGQQGDTATRLRDPANIALLASGPTEYVTSTGKPLMPLQTDATRDLTFCLPTRTCFISGNFFFNGNVRVIALYTLFFREHNRLAERLEELNPSWKADKVYQESRKILGATFQHIILGEYLPTLFSDFDEIVGDYRGYDSKVDPGIRDVLSTTSRWHHMLRPTVERLGPDYQPIAGAESLPLRDTTFSSDLFIDNGLDAFVRGIVATPARKPSPLSLFLDDFLSFAPTELSSQDFLRGRDRGLASYNTWRGFCGLPSCDGKGFECYADQIKEESVRNKLEKLYGSTKNVEIWIGGGSEDPIDGELLGPTFKCIIIDHFRRIRDGDSFWYERKGVFTPEQLSEIKKTSLARIICDNSDSIERVPENAFLLSDPDSYVSCDSIKGIDLEKFFALDTCTL